MTADDPARDAAPQTATRSLASTGSSHSSTTPGLVIFACHGQVSLTPGGLQEMSSSPW